MPRKPPAGFKKAMENAQKYRKSHPSVKWATCMKKGWEMVKSAKSGSSRSSRRSSRRSSKRRSSRRHSRR